MAYERARSSSAALPPVLPSAMRPYLGPPATLGTTLTAGLDLWSDCFGCRRHVHIETAQLEALARRHGRATPLPDLIARLVAAWNSAMGLFSNYPAVTVARMSRTLHATGDPIPREWYVVKPLPGCRIGEAEFGQDVASFMDGATLVVQALAPVSEHNPPLHFAGWENCFIEPAMPIRILDFGGTVLASVPLRSTFAASPQ